MKHTHPHIAGRRFSTPQGSDACFGHFVDTADGSPEELLQELSSEIAARHGRAIPIATASPQEHAFLLEISRFIVVYTLSPGTVEVSTVLAKQDPAHPDHRHYFTTTATLPEEMPAKVHPLIADKPITYLHLDEAFVAFALNVCEAATADLAIEDLEDTIRLRHAEAQPIHLPEHPRPLWELKTYFLRFRYQVLTDKVEVGDIWSRHTGQYYEPTHDLLAEYTK